MTFHILETMWCHVAQTLPKIIKITWWIDFCWLALCRAWNRTFCGPWCRVVFGIPFLEGFSDLQRNYKTKAFVKSGCTITKYILKYNYLIRVWLTNDCGGITFFFNSWMCPVTFFAHYQQCGFANLSLTSWSLSQCSSFSHSNILFTTSNGNFWWSLQYFLPFYCCLALKIVYKEHLLKHAGR